MQYVYSFRESNRDMIDLLGSKSINLSEMINLDLPVPNGFTISVDACQEYYKNGNKIASEVEFQMLSKLKALEKDSGKKFGSKDNPLLISIRSSLPSSASSAMCSILNLGMTQEIVEEMAKNNPRMAYDTYRRFILEYATIVKRYPDEYFNGYLENYKKSKGYKSDLDLKVDDFKLIIQKYKDNYLECGGSYFPNNPKEQLMSAIETVFLACNNDKVLDNNVAIVIQEMVYGNMNNNSGSGVLYTHNLINGEKILNCEFLLNTQGPDIILNKNNTLKIEFLKKNAPKIYEELINASKKLEIYYKDALEISFTIEDGKLFLLQAKKARRASEANIRIAFDLLKDDIITELEALRMIEPSDLETLMKPIFNINSIKKAQLLANGIGIKSGVACGRIVFDSNEAKLQDKDTILVKNEITGRDIDGLIHSCGILTKSCASNMLGGTRKFNQCAVVGESVLEIDEKNETLKINGLTLTKNDYISIDGNSGAIYKGKVELSSNEKGITLLKDILKLASKYETIQVRANCTTEEAIKKAYEYGAEGIDLVESEQILKNEECISNMIKIILSKEDRVINDALKKIEDYQEEYFYKVLKTMSAHPVNLKYLDTSLQQFLFKNESILESICNRLNLRIEETKNKINRSMSTNTITKYRNEMSVGLVQLRALIKGAIKVKKEGGEPTFEIRVPLPIRLEEFQSIKSIIEDNIKEITKQEDLKINYKVGVELRTPRDIMLSADISICADFYSYDIGNLTKLTLGLSEGDIYREESIRSIHKNGVGELIKFAKKNAKKNIEMGVHSGQDYNDSAIRFCQKAGLNYFSCSLDKVPMMRLISAQCSNDEK